jgi:DNA-binding NarL/FixJ family response regulator
VTRPKVRAGQVPSNGLPLTLNVQNPGVIRAQEGAETTVLVAVESAQVREALVAMLGAVDAFRVIAEADSDEAALEAARRQQPRLVLIEPELSDCRGWRVIQQIQAEQLACVVVALGRRANESLAQLVGAQSYVQMGTSPRDLLNALQTAVSCRRPPVSGSAETEHHLLSDADSVLDKPALVDL